MKIELFNYRVRLDMSIKKLVEVEGINSNLDDNNKEHILLWDFDEIPLSKIVASLKLIQYRHSLPKIYIVSSSINHYHAYCFTRQSKAKAMYILISTKYIDETYFKLGIVRGYWTLRITPKQVNNKFMSVINLDSKVPEDLTTTKLLQTVKYNTGV